MASLIMLDSVELRWKIKAALNLLVLVYLLPEGLTFFKVTIRIVYLYCPVDFLLLVFRLTNHGSAVLQIA